MHGVGLLAAPLSENPLPVWRAIATLFVHDVALGYCQYVQAPKAFFDWFSGLST